MVDKVDDYSNFNKPPWLIEFFKGSNITGILEAADRQFNDLENAAFDFFSEIWLENAEGEQLDVLGDIVGINRNGRNDTDYKAVIQMKIEINVSSGQPERLIQAVRLLYGKEGIEYYPNYPAKIRIYVEDQEYTLDEAQILLAIVPAGVGLILSEELTTEASEYLTTEAGEQLLTERLYV